MTEIRQKLLAGDVDSVSAQVANMRQFVTEHLSDIRQLLQVDVQRAKAELAKHITAIQMQPPGDGKKGHYVAIGDWNLLGETRDGPEEVRVRPGCGGLQRTERARRTVPGRIDPARGLAGRTS